MEERVENSHRVMERHISTGAVDFDCSICLAGVEVPVVTQCGHLFCWKCLHAWGGKSSICPVCKCDFELSSVIPIYSKGVHGTYSDLPKLPSVTRMYTDHSRQMYAPVFSVQYSEGPFGMFRIGLDHRHPGTKTFLFSKLIYFFIVLLCILIFLLIE